MRKRSSRLAKVETDRRRVTDRLKRDGWINEGGGEHDKYAHPARPGIKIMVPRHRSLSPGVARSIARAAGW
jgi:predicted RNA binding protein YcfA (HicA-like mRNA interferase family)